MSRRGARRMYLLRGLLMIAAITCICIGSLRGEAEIVLRKAVRICMECIGVGA